MEMFTNTLYDAIKKSITISRQDLSQHLIVFRLQAKSLSARQENFIKLKRNLFVVFRIHLNDIFH